VVDVLWRCVLWLRLWWRLCCCAVRCGGCAGQVSSPYVFPPYHEAVRAPFDFYEFGKRCAPRRRGTPRVTPRVRLPVTPRVTLPVTLSATRRVTAARDAATAR
jgi:hypothetical protein